MTKHHDIKIWPQYFEQVIAGKKPWEYRINDRGYETGDTLTMFEYHPTVGGYTGRKVYATVGYMVHCNSEYVAFTLKDIREGERANIIYGT